MEEYVWLVLLGIWLLIGPLVALVRAALLGAKVRTQGTRIEHLEARLKRLENGAPAVPAAVAAAPPVAEPVVAAEPMAPAPPPLPSVPPAPVVVEPAWLAAEESLDREAAPDMLEEPVFEAPVAARPARGVAEVFSLERFMGVKLFAWLGGVAMFFGVIFFVKYAVENSLVTPEMRVTLGFVAGILMLGGGVLLHRREAYRVLAQVFCATGVLILYGVSFAAHAIYHFAPFGPLPTFTLMALITVVAFLLAVRLNALVVAVLGMLGGFMTPVLVSTGHDNICGLFGYIALLDCGLLAVSRRRGWQFLTAWAAAGTVVIQAGWFTSFFVKGAYYQPALVWIPMAILLGFIILFNAGEWLGRLRRECDGYLAGAGLGMAATAMVFAFVMLKFAQVAERPVLLYGFVGLIQLAVIAQVLLRPQLGASQLLAAAATFLHLAAWSQRFLTPANLHVALAIYLIVGALHAAVPVVLVRRGPVTLAVSQMFVAGRWLGPLVVLLMWVPFYQLSPVPLSVWAAVLLANLLVIGLAALSGAVVPVVASLGVTMGLALMWLLRVPAEPAALVPFLLVVTGFAAVFALAGRWLVGREPVAQGAVEARAAAWLPVVAAVLPFGLLVVALVQLPVADPSPVFGVALLLTLLLVGLAILGRQGQLVLAALVASLAVELTWHGRHFQAAAPVVALAWYLGFYALFQGLPFVFRRQFAGMAAPWVASALAGVGHFWLVHNLIGRAWPNNMMGLVPVGFALPALACLLGVVRTAPTLDALTRSRLAWFGGAALWFITLVFPIQFDRQWLTVSWALEGALLLALYRRVPHRGLQLTGLVLLGIAFVRLTFNPAVFSDYPRSGTAIFNWHFYTYGLVAAAHLLGARWFTDPGDELGTIHPRSALLGMAGVLLFLLLNIEIADYFTQPGDRFIAFRFGGNFARDMSYSIGWGLFSLVVLGLGIWRRSKPARLAASALLVITLLKVFGYDLAAIGNIYRIIALMGVAAIAFATSFLYQKFFERSSAP